MKVKFLGIHGYHGAPNQNKTTCCVWIPELNIILDAGTGLWRLKPGQLNSETHLLLSHYHYDHMFGAYALHSLSGEKEKVIHFYGRNVESSIRDFYSPPRSPLIEEHGFTPLFHEIEDETTVFDINGARIESREFPHKNTSVLAFKIIHNGKTITYLTDTFGNIDELDLIKGSNLVIRDAHYLKRDVKKAVSEGHGAAEFVARTASQAEVEKLALYHLNPEARDYSELEEEAQRIFKKSFIPKESIKKEDKIEI